MPAKAYRIDMTSPVYSLSDDYINTVAELDPAAATYMGIAGHDHEMTDFSPAGHDARAANDRQTLAKPADAEDLEAALLADKDKKAMPPENPMSADRVKWEHIQRVFELCDRNVSETARRLKMHRRTLQRILSKRSPK